MNHPYILADRWDVYSDHILTKKPEDISPEEELDVSFYGYVRGSSYRINNKVYITGLGDFEISEIKVIEDPCPALQKEDKSLLQVENGELED